MQKVDVIKMPLARFNTMRYKSMQMQRWAVFMVVMLEVRLRNGYLAVVGGGESRDVLDGGVSR
jgi:hypothetical protein